MVILTYLMVGAFAGLIAGLLGVGGGILVVPALVLVFEAQGVSAEVLTHMAVGTSLATIVFTSLSAIINHHRLGGVKWVIFSPIACGMVIGAVAGVFTVVEIDGALLKDLIGGFAILIAIKMFLPAPLSGNRDLPPTAFLAGFGGAVGWISTIFGIGGGSLTVPFLSRYRLQMREVVGTASACGLPIALAGAATNMMMTMPAGLAPGWTIGYVYLPALVGIVLSSVYFARVGARLAHRLPGQTVRKLFASLLIAVGIRFIFFS